jgi:hypothetical protein
MMVVMLQKNCGHEMQGGCVFQSTHMLQEVPNNDVHLMDECAPHPRCKLEEICSNNIIDTS